MPTPRALPPPPSARPWKVAIVHSQTGRILRTVDVSDQTAKRMAELLDASGDVARAVGDIVGAVGTIRDVFGPLIDTPARPRRKLPSRGRR